MALVVDASVALKWVLLEPDSHLAQALVESDEELLLPDFWLNEATNICWLQTHKGKWSADEAREAACCTDPTGGWLAGAGSGRRVALFLTRGPVVPFKVNQDSRHHIPRQRHKVTNWAEYDAALRQRGSLTLWFTETAIAAWRAAPRTTPGGQPHYSALAIVTALTLRSIFRLALRQTEGLIGSIIGLLGLDLAIPDHSTLSRRAETLQVFPRPRLATSRCICSWTAQV